MGYIQHLLTLHQDFRRLSCSTFSEGEDQTWISTSSWKRILTTGCAVGTGLRQFVMRSSSKLVLYIMRLKKACEQHASAPNPEFDIPSPKPEALHAKLHGTNIYVHTKFLVISTQPHDNSSCNSDRSTTPSSKMSLHVCGSTLQTKACEQQKQDKKLTTGTSYILCKLQEGYTSRT